MNSGSIVTALTSQSLSFTIQDQIMLLVRKWTNISSFTTIRTVSWLKWYLNQSHSWSQLWDASVIASRACPRTNLTVLLASSLYSAKAVCVRLSAVQAFSDSVSFAVAVPKIAIRVSQRTLAVSVLVVFLCLTTNATLVAQQHISATWLFNHVSHALQTV